MTDGSNMLQAIRRAQNLHRQPNQWSMIIRNAMKTDCSWTRSAARYAEFYETLISQNQEQGQRAVG